MKMNQESKTPERLLMGLAMGLAASLCVLEYGKPILNQYAFIGEIGDPVQWIEEPVFITLPVQKQEPEVRPKPVDLNTTEFEIVPDEKYEKPEPIIPEYILDFPDVVMADTYSIPDIVLPPLPPYAVDEMPEFEGYASYLKKNVRFPSMMKDIGQEGNVWVEFAIGADGYIDPQSITILKSEHVTFSKEVIRVLKNMPRWKPGKKSGTAVPVLMTAPVRFHLK